MLLVHGDQVSLMSLPLSLSLSLSPLHSLPLKATPVHFHFQLWYRIPQLPFWMTPQSLSPYMGMSKSIRLTNAIRVYIGQLLVGVQVFLLQRMLIVHWIRLDQSVNDLYEKAPLFNIPSLPTVNHFHIRKCVARKQVHHIVGASVYLYMCVQVSLHWSVYVYV